MCCIVSLFFVLALLLGVAMTLPDRRRRHAGGDLAVQRLHRTCGGFEGFVLDNAAMIIAGTVVGSAGTLLTQLMARP